MENDQALWSFLQGREQEMLTEIESIDGNSFLNRSVDDWCDDFEQKYKFEVPRLMEDNILVSQREVLVPVINFHAGTTQEKGTEVRYFIPFEGDRELFKYKPSKSNPTLPGQAN